MQPNPPLTAVVFDLDGLMVNTEELYQGVGTELLRRRGKEFPPELLDRMMGRPGKVALQIMIDFHGLPDTVDLLQEESDVIFSEILPKRLAPMPGLLQLLAKIDEAGIPRAIATSSRRVFLDRVLDQLNLAERFRFFLTAENVTHGKPDPEIYRTAAARMGCSPEQMMVLEDSQNGCRAGISAGAFVVAVPSGHSSTQNFSGAKIIADTLADPRIIQALGIVE